MRSFSKKSSRTLLPCVVILVAISEWSHAFTSTKSYPLSFSSSFRLPTLQKASLVDVGTNAASNKNKPSDDETISCWDEGLLSPQHLLYPDAFRTSKIPFHRRLPLFSSLRLIRKAVKSSIIQNHTDFLGEPGKVLRIEQQISHTLDPLCWLQAQRKLNRHKDYPNIYFSTAEGNLEAAAFGSSIFFSGTADEETYWDIIQNLPPSTFMYGGQRFDSESTISQEWQEFQKGLWILPAVEVRNERRHDDSSMATTLAVHLVADEKGSLLSSARSVLDILTLLTDACTDTTPPTTLPPVLSRMSNYGENLDGQEIYEKGVMAALERFASTDSALDKVVLARRMDISFAQHASENVDALDILRKWKFGSQPGGHTFLISPGGLEGSEFFGCTPERLFSVDRGQIMTEALAGTRPRGSTSEADAMLSRELFESTKDQSENQITGNFIRDVFFKMERDGLVITTTDKDGVSTIGGDFFVRRLRHLQHICQRYQCSVADVSATNTTRRLLSELHPTPAVGGFPKSDSLEFIRKYESVGFDRGFYAGPVGYIGRHSAEIVVAIRSGLLTKTDERPRLRVFAGAGIVPGSSIQGEWAETAYKLAVVSSIFPQSPMTLQSASTPNVAWATAFIEELIRNGVTQFYICPGSRSTPLVAAIAKAVRSYVGLVRAFSIHDERGAAFRAVGYGRGAGRPAAVVTSSGTAVANLYPAVVEAGMDGVPMILLTADRPYESRNTGANQAIDQMKIFSDTYVRWFRDILPPSDEVAVSIALADASHGVHLAGKLRGPVHMNIQFRENLAPDAGQIRNDDRAGAVTRYDALKFTESPGFQRWSLGGSRWLHSYALQMDLRNTAFNEIGSLIAKSKRGMIVVGNLRKPGSGLSTGDASETAELISNFAQSIGFPIFASALAGNLRFQCSCVVPFAEHVLRSPKIQEHLQPDLVLQFGSPLISTEISKVIKSTMFDTPVNHILIHPHHSTERADPDLTVSHHIDAEIGSAVRALGLFLEGIPRDTVRSELVPIVGLGRILQNLMPNIVKEASHEVLKDACNRTNGHLSEPEVTIEISRSLSEIDAPDLSLFISNSMPIRDAEAFLYPTGKQLTRSSHRGGLKDTGVNRGASGIDGIISSAAGFADATKRPTTLVIGDVAALHDLNSLHALQASTPTRDAESQNKHPLTTIVLNNDGGGIFSFLPVANHGADVAFEEYFGTPTNSFSFKSGASAFGLTYHQAENITAFAQAYSSAIKSGDASLIEAFVAPRDLNVLIHKEITKRASTLIESILDYNEPTAPFRKSSLPMKKYHARSESYLQLASSKSKKLKTMVLLHGWMGDKSEWDTAAETLAENLKGEWRIVALDLPGHGNSEILRSDPVHLLRSSLRLDEEMDSAEPPNLSLDAMAVAVEESLKAAGIERIDALAGYSLGGRVALAMQRASLLSKDTLLSTNSSLILLSANPGRFTVAKNHQILDQNRLKTDDQLASTLSSLLDQTMLLDQQDTSSLVFAHFLDGWYDAPIWGSIKKLPGYQALVDKRARSLAKRARDHSAVLQLCSPPRCRADDWRAVQPKRTLFLSGALDEKYNAIGAEWSAMVPDITVRNISCAGHSLLFEAPNDVATMISDFLRSDDIQPKSDGAMIPKEEEDSRAAMVLEQPSSTLEISGLEDKKTTVASLDFERFTIDYVSEGNKVPGIAGIGWGEKATAKNEAKRREGFIIQLMSVDGLHVGIGEVAPLEGLHPELLAGAEEQLSEMAQKISEIGSENSFSFNAGNVLSLDGSLSQCVDGLLETIDMASLLFSVRAGIEMALISLASQAIRTPPHQAVEAAAPIAYRNAEGGIGSLLSLNGLITRGSAPAQMASDQLSGKDAKPFRYESWKVKVGHQNAYEDAMAISYAYQIASSDIGEPSKIRADANQAFNETTAIEFANILKEIDVKAFERLEYVEEPLKRSEHSIWSFSNHLQALEDWSAATQIPFALDESLSDLAEQHSHDFDAMRSSLQQAFASRKSGCTAFVLKPSLLGMELSMRLARLARTELGIGAVFTSSFDSGVGLAFTSFLASLSDATSAIEGVPTYAHGLGTFSLFADDCITPSFGSYVNQHGKLNVASLSRAFYGLGLDELRCLSIEPLPSPELSKRIQSSVVKAIENTETLSFNDFDLPEDFEASTSTSSDGREIQVVASLPLPFSADVACSRFTDLPQQPRWSPWISSVSYVDATSETEWRLRIRGVNFRWRAKSALLSQPDRGIRWQSISGLKNTGAVEFIPTDAETCLMKVQITFVSPRILSPLFKGTTIFFEDFLRNKVLKWSLEMFRDVVKGDLALEEGNVELGDALFGAVEGKANAIEATFSNPVDKE